MSGLIVVNILANIIIVDLGYIIIVQEYVYTTLRIGEISRLNESTLNKSRPKANDSTVKKD